MESAVQDAASDDEDLSKLLRGKLDSVAAWREICRKYIQILKRQKAVLQKLCKINPDAKIDEDPFPTEAGIKLSGIDKQIARNEKMNEP